MVLVIIQVTLLMSEWYESDNHIAFKCLTTSVWPLIHSSLSSNRKLESVSEWVWLVIN